MIFRKEDIDTGRAEKGGIRPPLERETERAEEEL